MNTNKLKKKVKQLKITDFPSIIVYSDFDSDGEKLASPDKITYKGKQHFDDLVDFLTPFALLENYDPNAADKPQYQKRGKYTFVNYKNYTRGLMDDYRAQVVFFEKDYENIREKFETIAKYLHGPVNVVFFNCEHKLSQEIVEEKFEVKKFPKIFVFSTGSEKDFDSALDISIKTSAMDILGIVESTEIQDNLREVSDSVLSSLILTNAIQLNKITLVYLYEGEEDAVPLSFKSLSSNPVFSNHFEFVALKNPGALTIQQFQVPKLPVIIGGIPPPDDIDPESPEAASSIRTMIYQGKINDYFELLEFNLGVKQSFFPEIEEQQRNSDKASEVSTKFQEVDATNFDEICESRKGLCAIGFLNGDVSTEETAKIHKTYLQILEERNNDSGSQFKYMWINTSCHQYLLPEFELSDMFIPTVVIYAPGAGKYTRMVTTFIKENIIEFEKSFEGTGSGRIIIYDIPKRIGEKIKDLDCPNLVQDNLNLSDEENMLDKEMEEEIMREILEEERIKMEELKEENGGEEEIKHKKKKKSKGKNKKKKGKKKK